VVVSGTPVRRPRGQLGEGRFGPTEALDFECELGFVAGPSTGHGEPLAIDEAAERIFGVALLNDWSARDIQMWESRPLGPFLGKSFQTSISSWIVPLDELPKVTPREQDPPPEGYLREAAPFALDIPLEVTIDGELVTRTNARDLYWTLPQMLTHATVNGAKLTAGDLFGTGTISGPDEGSRACLLERFRGRRWLADGEEVVLASPLLGECRGTVVPATRPTGRASG
jgi:fumarylacetoacetase